ncbi:uncharacterized protein LOC118738178, partial [Rhagoletis pomonella]|uniref:uncharacterized protein LOC118738178 n=1 Tax=Rhagoletis pomonella TaxID=28610 RepID=UPI00177B3CF1
MRAVLILCSVISATYAASLGYNYESNNGPSLGGGLSGGQVGGPSYGGLAAAGPSYSGPATFGPSYSGPSSSGPSYNAPAEFNKEYFTYTAPEHEFDDAGNNDQLANSLKKNLRVIFIKGPENTGLE